MAITEKQLDDRLSKLKKEILDEVNLKLKNLELQIQATVESKVNDMGCKAGLLPAPLYAIQGTLGNLNDNTSYLTKLFESINNHLNTIKQTESHVHNSHRHPRFHKAEDGLDVKNGKPFLGDSSDETTFLITEMQTKIDKDENGMIYGYDFMIDEDDPDKPMHLRELEDSMGLPEPAVKLTWSQYLESLPWT